jgi:hypothetical protein
MPIDSITGELFTENDMDSGAHTSDPQYLPPDGTSYHPLTLGTGLQVKSPDGTVWLVKVANDGTLSTEAQ